jgi:hypothetical protein
MARQRALSESILSNGNLWAGQRSLILGHSGKPFFQQIKDRRRNMEQTVYNPQKGRLETINIYFTDENTTSELLTWRNCRCNNGGIKDHFQPCLRKYEFFLIHYFTKIL